MWSSPVHGPGFTYTPRHLILRQHRTRLVTPTAGHSARAAAVGRAGPF